MTCTYIPKVGAQLMRGLRQQFDYPEAKKIFLIATNPEFIRDYRHTLELDSEGVPTLTSVLSNSYIQNKIGQSSMLKSLNKNRNVLDDTIDNYETLLQEAYHFNTDNPNRDNYLATVSYTENGKITTVVVPKTEKALTEFKNEYRRVQLNKRLAEMFSPLGVTVGLLTEAETRAGRVGVTDFSVADRIAQDFVSIIKVANNKEGAQAVSEEFAHLIIGAMNNNPLIQRSLNVLRNNPEAIKQILKEDYDDIVSAYNENMDLVAEEALGHILQDNLIENTNIDSLENKTLYKRTVTNIKQQFKNYDDSEVNDIISEVNQMMSTVAQNLLSNRDRVTADMIKSSVRDVQLNALSDRVERNLKILSNARNVEVRRYRIAKTAEDKQFAMNNITEIDSTSNDEVQIATVLCNYTLRAINELKSVSHVLQTVGSSNSEQLFSILRYTKTFISSYGTFITELTDALIEDETEADSALTKNLTLENGTITNIKQLLSELQSLSATVSRQYIKLAQPAFCEFLKPYLGETVIQRMSGENKGQELLLEELLTSGERDISFMDRWLDSMGDSADILLQLFDQVVKQAKDEARLKTIDGIREIHALRQEAEEAGITNFEWMFEKDAKGNKSGDYIGKVARAEFFRQYKEFLKQLDEKYGKNPTGVDATNKVAEKKNWLEQNSLSSLTPIPNPNIWINKDYVNLSDKQKEILEKFLQIKEKYDMKLPDTKVDRLKAVQIRKSTAQRFIESGTSPSTILDNLKNYYQETFLDKIDDDQIFGASTRSGMADFEGHEYMVLPVVYTNRLENPNELSTDVFGTLMQYMYMANQYESMDNVIDPLEVGRTLVKENRKIKINRGDFPVIEKIKTKVGSVTGQLFTDKSNVEQKLDDFFESQVYLRYLKDSGAFTVLGKQVNKNKIVSWILNRSSLAMLGFNWLANTANVLTGACMQHIESAANEYFSPAELFKADSEYAKLMAEFVPEIGSRNKQSKLALFDELINFKGDFSTRIKGEQKKNWLQRIFGENIAFLGQDAGDHWLYNRTAIAMALRQKVIVPGKGEMSLWDALEIVETQHGTELKKMILPEGTTDLNGNQFSVTKWARQVLHVNQSLFGIYNEEDSNAANRVMAGRLLLQFRKWIKPQYNRRFQRAQQNLTSGKIEEGYYRTMLRMMNEVIRGQMQMSTVWEQMTNEEKANVKRAITELIQFFAVWALCNFVEWPDDKNRPWAIKMAEYASKRLCHELGGLAPSLTMADEMLKNLRNPLPAVSMLIDYKNLIASLFDPRDYVDELQSGPYKGYSTLEKHLVKAPIPGIRQYMQVDKFRNQLDTSIDYYARPYGF